MTTRRGKKRTEPEPSDSQDVAEAVPSRQIVVNEDLSAVANIMNTDMMPPLSGEEAWESSSTAAAIVANTAQENMMDATEQSAINNQMPQAAEMHQHPTAQQPMNPSEFSQHQYHEFVDWLNRWHVYQHSLANYWTEYNRDSFNRKCLELTEYKERHGDCNVPSNYMEEEPLGKWVERMKAEAREGRLDVAKVEHLRSLGFDFGHDGAV